MKVSNLRSEDATYFLTRSSIFMPMLMITQLNIGIFMVFGGPYINRTFRVVASVLFFRQLLSATFLLIFLLMTKKFNLSVATKKDWIYNCLCGKHHPSLSCCYLGVFGISLP